jgi:hypothetical protein
VSNVPTRLELLVRRGVPAFIIASIAAFSSIGAAFDFWAFRRPLQKKPVTPLREPGSCETERTFIVFPLFVIETLPGQMMGSLS